MNIKFFLLLLSGLLLNATSAVAGIVINSTRVIYPEEKSEVTVRLESQNDYSSLVQSWIDSGNKNEEIKNIKVPFILLPPITRIEPHQGQTLRISYLEEGFTLPTDRETVFWLNVLDIPPKSSGNAENFLQMAIRTRIKLFFRPKSLQDISPAQAAEKLVWRLVKDNKKTVLEAENSSPFHISIASVETNLRGENLRAEGQMIAPFSKAVYAFTGNKFTLSKFKYVYINDYGASVPIEREI
ncbi:pilus assembly protein [Mixta theicola]|uniref:Pilus assembly protein n=1 Tax=Mixta theicola TaxID=1458355 RepID=A0A2K1Q8E9_9GAMM|nr:fimbria/pilus periplasmic chaperone [Mixta theicola]PNS11257.1 pilus assembly protein [Mixta theicola]GLR07473.1 fimbria-related chaperone [Mixta theicola]